MIRIILVLVTTTTLTAQDDDAAIKKRKDAHQPRASYLDNSHIKIGVDLNLGGAIVYLSKSGSEHNLVNNWDWGRQIQMSHYSGPQPFRVEGKAVAKAWQTFPWNPVQAGDHFGHASKLLDSTNDGKEIYVKSRPMQWSLEDAPSECTFETWINLEDATARVRCRMTVDRADTAQYRAFSQEMPALYLNGPYHRLYSYTGDQPFTNGELTCIAKGKDEPKDFPWSRFLATENWAALVNDDNWGVGIWQPSCVSFLGGFSGTPGPGGTKDGPTGYIAPVRNEIIDHNIAFEYSYVLIVGPLDDIRKHATARAGKPKPPSWTFAKDRQGWTYENATDTGWPIAGELSVSLEKAGVHLVGPVSCWQASTAPTLKIDAAFPPAVTKIKVFWATHQERRFSEVKSVLVPVQGDRAFHSIDIKLSESPHYQGTLTQLRIDPIGTAKGDRLRVKAVAFR